MDINLLSTLKTVGAFIRYEDTLVFMVGPDSSGKKLGIVRLGGHVEQGESLQQALEREIKEEGSIKVKLIDSPCTLYKNSWDDSDYFDIADLINWNIKPLVIKKDKLSSTAVFLSYTYEEPKPSSEAYGLVFLKYKDIINICSNKLTLRDFINDGGKFIKQKEIDYDMEICAGVHLSFLYKLLEDKNEVAIKYIKGDYNER
ncbi:hydrolase, NUDIX family [Clostridiales bacterium oral taxon 876 str. F0540]|nr:hydrolase, NUDIX family [Clostridiales bacterium oral taxon 876 str. F0540]